MTGTRNGHHLLSHLILPVTQMYVHPPYTHAYTTFSTGKYPFVTQPLPTASQDQMGRDASVGRTSTSKTEWQRSSTAGLRRNFQKGREKEKEKMQHNPSTSTYTTGAKLRGPKTFAWAELLPLLVSYSPSLFCALSTSSTTTPYDVSQNHSQSMERVFQRGAVNGIRLTGVGPTTKNIFLECLSILLCSYTHRSSLPLFCRKHTQGVAFSLLISFSL